MQRNCTVLAFVYWLFFQKLLLTVGSEYGCRTFAVASVIINADWLCKDDESGAKMHPGTGSVTPPWPANDTKNILFPVAPVLEPSPCALFSWRQTAPLAGSAGWTSTQHRLGAGCSIPGAPGSQAWQSRAHQQAPRWCRQAIFPGHPRPCWALIPEYIPRSTDISPQARWGLDSELICARAKRQDAPEWPFPGAYPTEKSVQGGLLIS